VTSDHAKIFDHIYQNDLWKGGSGLGSTEENTRAYRQFLHNFLRSNAVRSVVDLGCGDWQFSRHVDWKGIDYLGIDVSKVVLENTRSFTGPGIEFRELNAVTEPLPAADLLLAKDVLQHWSNADILALLPKLSAYRYALITNGFLATALDRVNTDITPGRWRPVDLLRPPFSLPGAYVFWFQADEPKYVFLWTRSGA
jgi:SAM-dependent methyltransferase